MPPRNRKECKTPAEAAKVLQTSMENVSDDGVHAQSECSSAKADCSTSLTSVTGSETQSTSQHISEDNNHGGRKCEFDLQNLESTSLKLSKHLNPEDSFNRLNEDSLNSEDSFNRLNEESSNSEDSFSNTLYEESLVTEDSSFNKLTEESLNSEDSFNRLIEDDRLNEELWNSEDSCYGLNEESSNSEDSCNRLIEEPSNSKHSFTNSDQNVSTSNEISQSEKSGYLQTTSFNQDNYSEAELPSAIKKHKKKKFSILSFQKPSKDVVDCPRCKQYFYSKENMKTHLQYNCTLKKRENAHVYCRSETECSLESGYTGEEDTSDDCDQVLIKAKSVDTHLDSNNSNLAADKSDDDKAQDCEKSNSGASDLDDSNNSNTTGYAGEEDTSDDCYQVRIKAKSVATHLYSNNSNTTVYRRIIPKSVAADKSDGDKAQVYAKSKSRATDLDDSNNSNRVLPKSLAFKKSVGDREIVCTKSNTIATSLRDSNISNRKDSKRIFQKSLVDTSGGDRDKVCTNSNSIATKLGDSNISNTTVSKGIVTRSLSPENIHADRSGKVVEKEINDSKSDAQVSKSPERKIPKSVNHDVGDTRVKLLKKSAKSTAMDNFDDGAKGLKRGACISATLHNPDNESFEESTSES